MVRSLIYLIHTNKQRGKMPKENLDLTRREFMLAGSAAVAGAAALEIAGTIPAAEAAAIKSTATGNQKTYYIGHECMGCQVCRMKCPAKAINFGDDRNEIDQSKCIHCGTCYRECPVSVISEI
jgi:NAD-dependent dihydropyrimidine dehydrogenase PreA subunit